jgi:hypothetical protein
MNCRLISAFEIAGIFRLFWLTEFSKNDVRSKAFTSRISYCTEFEEDCFVATYPMALLISMLASRVLRKNTFLGNVEN